MLDEEPDRGIETDTERVVSYRIRSAYLLHSFGECAVQCRTEQ